MGERHRSNETEDKAGEPRPDERSVKAQASLLEFGNPYVELIPLSWRRRVVFPFEIHALDPPNESGREPYQRWINSIEIESLVPPVGYSSWKVAHFVHVRKVSHYSVGLKSQMTGERSGYHHER